jgi:hypothetical protein
MSEPKADQQPIQNNPASVAPSHTKSKPDAEAPSKKVSLLNIISSVFGIIIIAIFIVLSIFVDIRLNEVDYTYSSNFGQNWANGPLNGLDVEATGICPYGSSYVLSNVKFPGFKSGCFCPPDKYFEGQCNEDQKKKNCQFFPESAPKATYSWGGAICADRQDDTYFALNKTNPTAKNKDCPKDHKPCGLLDSIDSLLCIKDEDKCPLNFIQIISKGQEAKQDFATKTQPISNGDKTLVFSNENNKGRIVNQFTVLDHKPCADAAENRIQLDAVEYKCKNEIAGKLFDESWQFLDDMPLEQFVDDNALTAQMSQYPFYSQLKNRKLSLFYRNYIGLNETCRNLSLTLASSKDIPQHFINMQNYVQTSNIDFISPVTIVIFVIILLCLIFKIYLAASFGSESYKLYINTTAAFCSILLLIISLVSTISISNARNSYIWFSNYPDCSDPLNQALLNKFDSKLQAAYTLGVVFTLLNLIMFFILVLEYLLKNCYEEVPIYEEEEENLEGGVKDVKDEDKSKKSSNKDKGSKQGSKKERKDLNRSSNSINDEDKDEHDKMLDETKKNK